MVVRYVLDGQTRLDAPDHTVPYGTGHVHAVSQAFHAWLLSSGPSGTEAPVSLYIDTHGQSRIAHR